VSEDLDIIRPDLKLGVLELSIAVLTDAASIASTVPYMGQVAGIFLQIITIKGVRFYFDGIPFYPRAAG
jgi:hypothetical protein